MLLERRVDEPHVGVARGLEQPLRGLHVVVRVAVEARAPARAHAGLAGEVEDDVGALEQRAGVDVDEVRRQRGGSARARRATARFAYLSPRA